MTSHGSCAQTAALDKIVFSSVSEGIIVFQSVRNKDGVIIDLELLDANPAALDIVGRGRADLIGKKQSQVFPRDFKRGVFDSYKNALETGDRAHFEIHYLIDSVDYWFDVSANPANADLLIVTFFDISRAKRDAALLASREAELRFILDAVPARIWFKDDKNTILRLNKAAAEAVNLPIEAVEGASAYDLFPEVAADYHRDDLEALEFGRPLLGIIERLIPANGDQGWLSTDKIPFDDPETGEPRLLAVATDISRQKAAEEELRLANESLEHFASIAAHDLQAPLRQIGMLADLLNSELSAIGGAPLAKEYADQILAKSNHLRMLVSRLLEFSKVGTNSTEFKSVELQGLIEAAVATKEVGLTEDAQVQIDLRGPPKVLGDETLLFQVFTNLIENSVKYGASQGLQLRITSQWSKGLCTIRVWDNGPGINAQFAERIFEVFSRLEDSSTQQGAGIGLAFCRKVLTRHNGSIELDRTTDHGTCFVLTLPPAIDQAYPVGMVQ